MNVSAIKYLLLIGCFSVLTACGGGGGGGSSDPDPTPAPTAERATWDDTNWDDSNWQ